MEAQKNSYRNYPDIVKELDTFDKILDSPARFIKTKRTNSSNSSSSNSSSSIGDMLIIADILTCIVLWRRIRRILPEQENAKEAWRKIKVLVKLLVVLIPLTVLVNEHHDITISELIVASALFFPIFYGFVYIIAYSIMADIIKKREKKEGE